MFKIQNYKSISKTDHPLLLIIRRCITGKTPTGSKGEQDSKLTYGLKNEGAKLYGTPSRFRNPITVPMMMSSFFNKKFNDLAKEMLYLEPHKPKSSSASTSAITLSDNQPFNTNAEFNEKGMTLAIEMKGFKEEDITVRVEGPWLVIEGQSSVTVPEREGGGLHVRHVIRRYEVPPNSDVSNIKSSFKSETLTITVPNLTPKITKV